MITIILLLLLFVPIKYKIDAVGNAPQLSANAKFSWLLHALTAVVAFDINSGIIIKIKLFCFKLYFKEIKLKGKKDKANDIIAEEAQPADEPAAKVVAESRLDEQVYNSVEEIPVNEYKAETLSQEEIDKLLNDSESEEADKEAEAVKAKISLSNRLEQFKQKLKDVAENAKDSASALLQTIKAFADNAIAKLLSVKEKIEKAIEFKDDENNQRAFILIIDTLKQLLYHIRPRYAKGRALIGLKDPAMTGEIVGAYYMLFPEAEEGFKLTASFDEEVIEGEGILKGHIRLNHVIKAFLTLWFNKTIRSWFKK